MARLPLLLMVGLLISSSGHTEGEGPACNLLYAKVYGLDAKEAEIENLFSVPPRSPEKTRELNAETLSLLSHEAPPQSANRKSAFTLEEAKAFYSKVSKNPQVSESLCGGYKGSSRGIGFCFGRAMAAHLMAIEAGLNTKSIRKLWAVGSLDNGAGNKWRYHVTTLVQVEGKGWYAVDPIQGRLLSVDEWFNAMKKYDADGTMRIYSTAASRFSPERVGKYKKSDLANDYYHGFFGDLIDRLHQERTGKPSPWAKLEDPEKKADWMNRALLGAGIALPSAVAGSLIKNYLDPKKTRPEAERN